MCLKTKKPQVKASFEKMMRRPLPTPTPKEMPASILEAWQKDLAADRDQLVGLYNNARAVTPERDAKLQCLKKLIGGKLDVPLNAGNRKALVFTLRLLTRPSTFTRA